MRLRLFYLDLRPWLSLAVLGLLVPTTACRGYSLYAHMQEAARYRGLLRVVFGEVPVAARGLIGGSASKAERRTWKGMSIEC